MKGPSTMLGPTCAGICEGMWVYTLVTPPALYEVHQSNRAGEENARLTGDYGCARYRL